MVIQFSKPGPFGGEGGVGLRGTALRGISVSRRWWLLVTGGAVLVLAGLSWSFARRHGMDGLSAACLGTREE